MTALEQVNQEIEANEKHRAALHRKRLELLRLQGITVSPWQCYNTFLGRPVYRNYFTGDFRIIGGQVTVTA